MSNRDRDLELLESWLDGELSDEQVEALRRRVSGEPELAQILDRLRADRALRTRAWQELEPLSQETESLVASVRRSVRREELFVSRLHVFRNVGAIAASVAVVFMAGWFSRTRLHVGPLDMPTSTASLASTAGTGPSIASAGTFQSSAPILMLRPPIAPEGFSLGRPAVPQSFRVVVYDGNNNVRMTRDLDRVEDAARFVDELARLQNPREPAREQPVFVDHLIVP